MNDGLNLPPDSRHLPVVFMFSGHGTQYPRMGKLFYENEPVFRKVLDEGEAIAKPLLGASLLDEIFKERGRGEHFDRTKFTHPALFLVQWGIVEVLRSHGVFPRMLLGSSLGELTAMAVAGVWSFEEMLLRCCQEGVLIEQLCSPGGMTAVFHDVNLYAQDEILNECVDLAGVNLPKIFVISSDYAQLEKVEAHLSQLGILYQRLPVRQAFHSKLMSPYEPELRKSLMGFGVRSAKLQIWSCVSGQELTSVTEAQIWDVVIKPIQLLTAILNLEAVGPWYYLDCGPSGTLATTLKYILPPTTQSRYAPLMTRYARSLENLEKVMAHFANSALK
jgi:acyl transferase domain-containing protein